MVSPRFHLFNPDSKNPNYGNNDPTAWPDAVEILMRFPRCSIHCHLAVFLLLIKPRCNEDSLYASPILPSQTIRRSSSYDPVSPLPHSLDVYTILFPALPNAWNPDAPDAKIHTLPELSRSRSDDAPAISTIFHRNNCRPSSDKSVTGKWKNYLHYARKNNRAKCKLTTGQKTNNFILMSEQKNRQICWRSEW